MSVASEQLTAAVAAVESVLAGQVEGAYLYGSAVTGGLRPASDLDLLVVLRGPATHAQRGALVDRLTSVSSRALRPPSWRPLELTMVVGSDVNPWRYPPRMDFQYGEWMRGELDAGIVPGPRENPDLALLIAMVRLAARPLLGPPAAQLLPPVPETDLVQAMIDSLPSLIGDLEPDTANVLLTLGRMWKTIVTAEFSPKDVAAEWTLARLADAQPVEREALQRARNVYLGRAQDEWSGLGGAVHALANRLRKEIADSARQLTA